MLGSNSVYGASVLDDCQQTLDVVADKVSFMSNKFCKWLENINTWKYKMVININHFLFLLYYSCYK